MSAPPTYRSLPPELDPRRPARTVVPQAPVRLRRRLPRLLGWLAAITSALVLLSSIGGYMAYRHYDGNIARVQDIVLPGHQQPTATGKAENILLVGSDSRAAFTKAELGSDTTAGARSDTMILAHIPADGSKAILVSMPRDSWVQIPQWKDRNGKVRSAHFGRLNSAFSTGVLPGGNAALLIATVENLSGLRIDHYVQIDFLGFQRMVDALGGIHVCLLHDAKDESGAHINLSAGQHDINGKTALAFVRQRHGLVGGDLGRIKRQQYFISAVMNKVTSAGTLLNPWALSRFLDQATRSVSADRELSLRDLALRARRLDPQHVQFTTLPITGDAVRGNNESVLLVDEPGTAALFASLRDDAAKPSASPTPTGPRLVVAPAAISVRVYNGSGTSGLATRATGDLRNAGFSATTAGNRGTGATATVIRYGPTRADSARTLAAAVPGAQLVLDPALGRSLQLVVGSGYAGAHAVAVTTTTSPAPSVAPSPPPLTSAASNNSGCAP